VLDETLAASSSPSAAASTKLDAWIWQYLTLFFSYPDAGRPQSGGGRPLLLLP